MKQSPNFQHNFWKIISKFGEYFIFPQEIISFSNLDFQVFFLESFSSNFLYIRNFQFFSLMFPFPWKFSVYHCYHFWILWDSEFLNLIFFWELNFPSNYFTFIWLIWSWTLLVIFSICSRLKSRLILWVSDKSCELFRIQVELSYI